MKAFNMTIMALLALLGAGSLAATPVLASSAVAPVHHWPFDEGEGTKSVDIATTGEATLTGATWARDRFGEDGRAVQTGYQMWVDPPDSVKVETGTFAAWIYVDVLGGYNQRPGPVFSSETGRGASGFAYRLQVNSEGFAAFEAVAPLTTTGERAAVSGSDIPVGEWTHLAGTYDGYTSRIYINGSLDGSSETFDTYAPMNTSGSIPVGIGHLPGWSVQWFQGRIDDARIYDVALSPELIASEFGFWKGYPVDGNGWVDTGPWLGWVYPGNAPWIWVRTARQYVYLDDTGWIYWPRQ